MRPGKNDTALAPAPRASLAIGKRGAPKAVRIGTKEYARLAGPTPEVLAVIGEESRRKGTNTLSSREINRVIKAARAQSPKRG